MAKSKNEVNEVLVEFGLTDVEAQVYQAALALGSRPASVIAQKAKLKRGHGYNVLHSLMQKGIVQEFVKNGVKHFTCSPPSSLISMLENRERELKYQKLRLEHILPDLENLRNPLAAAPKVRFFQGFDGLKEVFDDMLRVPNSDLLALVDLQLAWMAIGQEGIEWIQSFIQRREEKNIVWRGICVASEKSDQQIKIRPSKLRQMKRIEGIQCPAEIWMYGSKVAFTSTHSELVGVIIENEPISQTMRDVFEKLWQTLPDYVTT